MAYWYPNAEALPFAHPSGGSMVGGPPRGVLHTTEVFAYTPSKDSYYGHRNPPHLTLDVQRSKFWQHYPFNVAARALKNLAGGVQTNRQGSVNVQIEICWQAGKIGDLPTKAYDMLVEFMTWAEKELKIPHETSCTFVGSAAYGYSTRYRMSGGEWVKYTGWCGHQHVPENNHWNPGAINVDRLFKIPPLADTIEGGYADRKEWPSWAGPSIQKAIDSGVIIGGVVDGKKVWNPNHEVTRAQMALILDRLGLLEGQ